MSTQNQNKLELSNREVVLAATSDGATISVAPGRELTLEAPGGTKMVQINTDGSSTEFNVKTRLDAIDTAVAANNSDTGDDGIVKKIADSTADVVLLETGLQTYVGGVDDFNKQYNTQGDDAHATSVHPQQQANIASMINERQLDILATDTTLTEAVAFVSNGGSNTNSLEKLTEAVGEMIDERDIQVSLLSGSNTTKLANRVTNKATTNVDKWDDFLANCDTLCSDNASAILKALIDEIDRADAQLRGQIESFTQETFALVTDFRNIVSSTSGVTAVITSSAQQTTDVPTISGTLEMSANKTFFLYFNNVAFNITPESNSGSHEWSLDFSDTNAIADKKVYSFQSVIVRTGSLTGDRNDIVIIEYDRSSGPGTRTVNKIAASQRLVIDTQGPVVLRDSVTPPSTLVEMDTFTISGNVGEVGVKVAIVLSDNGVDGLTWEQITGQDGAYSFKPYVDIPISGGSALPKSAEPGQSFTFRVEATDTNGKKSVSSNESWVVNLDSSVQVFSVTSGTHYTVTQPTFSGMVDADSTVSLTYGGQTVTDTAGSDGKWSLQPSVALPESQELNLIFQAVDPALNTRELIQSVKVYTGAPVFATSGVAARIINSQIHSFAGGVSPVSGAPYGGVTSVDLTVTNANGDDVTGNSDLTLTTNGNITGILRLPDADGEYIMMWTATNNFGTTATQDISVRLDRVKPTVTMGDQVSTDPQNGITINGTWTDHGTDKLPVIAIVIEGTTYNATALLGNSGSNDGTWSSVLKAAPGQTDDNREPGQSAITFTDKVYSVGITITDAAGNQNSITNNLGVDTGPPGLDISTTPVLQTSSTEYEVWIRLTEPNGIKSVVLAIGGNSLDVTNQMELDGSTVKVKPGWQARLGSPRDGWTLVDGDHSVSVTATDTYNRVATKTKLFSIDATGPGISFGSPTEIVTSDGAVTFSGTSDETLLDVKIAYAQSTAGSYSPDASATVIGTSWSYAATDVPYGLSAQLRVTAKDALQNQTISYFTFTHTDPPVVSGTFINPFASFETGFLNQTLTFDFGSSALTGIVTEYDAIEWIEIELHGEKHRLGAGVEIPHQFGSVTVSAYLDNALTQITDPFYAPWHLPEYRDTHRLLQVTSGSISAYSGERKLLPTLSLDNCKSCTIKWAGRDPELVYEFCQAYVPQLGLGTDYS